MRSDFYRCITVLKRLILLQDTNESVFDQIVSSLKGNDKLSVEKEELSARLNPARSEWGSHVKLLSVSASLTKGDILEMGTGLFSTPELHRQENTV